MIALKRHARRNALIAMILATGVSSPAVGEWLEDCSGAVCLDTPGYVVAGTSQSTGTDVTSCGFNDFRDIWFSYSPAVSGPVTFDTCLSSFDTTLAVFDDCGGAELACDDDSCGLQSRITINMTAGERYLIRVAGHNGAGGIVNLNVDVPNLGCGDECPSCLSIEANESEFDSLFSTGSTDDTSCAFNDTIDRWWCFLAPADGFAVATTCMDPFADTDTTLAAFDACGGSELACNDDFCGLSSLIDWPVTSGETYYVRVSAVGGATGSYELTIMANDDCALPYPILGDDHFVFANGLATEDGVDHDACFFSGQAGFDHDAWFRWTSEVTGPVEVSTCGQTVVDTKLAVYEDTGACPPGDAQLLACNDDDCDLQSTVVFTAEMNRTYLIRLGTYPGASGGSGGFTVRWPDPACTEPPERCQPYEMVGGVFSDGSAIVADDFTPAADADITRVCWWGLHYDEAIGILDCPDIVPTNFIITYYDDGGGRPGEPVATFRVSDGSLRLDVALPLPDIFLDPIEYTASHSPFSVDAGSCYWISILNDVQPCKWSWAESVAGNSRSRAAGVPPDWGLSTVEYEDLAFCLDIPLGDPVPCFCFGDVNDNGVVDTVDLLALLGSWGATGFHISADFNDDNVVDVVDLLILLGNWGPC